MIDFSYYKLTADLPVMELPVQLEEHIKVLMRSDILSGWSIYSEKNGGICVKIRFKGSRQGPTESIGFKRKSLSQMSRDRQTQDSCISLHLAFG